MIITRDLKPSTPQGIVFALKEALVSAGWSVTTSSDGTTYSATEDVITTAAALGAAGAWFVVQDPNGRSWCWQTDDPGVDPADWRVKYSPSTGFPNGSPAATVTPSAADEYVVVGAGTDASPTYETLFAASGTQNVQIAADHGGMYRFYLVGYPDAGVPSTFIFSDALIPGSYPAADTDPVVVAALYETGMAGAPSTAGVQAVSGTRACFAHLSTSIENVVGLSLAITGLADLYPPTGSSGANAFNGNTDTAPIVWSRPGDAPAPHGWKGISGLLRWNGGAQVSGSRVQVRTQHDHVVFGRLVLPWDGGAAPANAVAGAVDFKANDYGRAGPYSSLQGVSPSAGASLGVTFDEGRWVPITLTIEKASGEPIMVWGKLSTGAYAWQVIYHEGAGGFAPLFSSTSTATPGGDTLTLSILPLGGWTAAPELYVGEFGEMS